MSEELLTTTPEPDEHISEYPQLTDATTSDEEEFCTCEACTCEDYCGTECFCCCAEKPVEKPTEPSTWQIWKWMLRDSLSYAVIYFILLSLPWKWANEPDLEKRFFCVFVYFLCWLTVNLCKYAWRSSHGTLYKFQKYIQW